MICDEAHFLKSTGSLRTRALLPMIRKARRAILLTGTPAVNNAAELYPLVDALLPGLVPSEDQFLERYCEKQQFPGMGGRQVVRWKGSRKPEELHLLLTSTVMIRRLKDQVLAQLPTKRRQRVRLEVAQLKAGSVSEIS